jgi:hypothetical protein
MTLHHTSIDTENASNHRVGDSRRPVASEDATDMRTLSSHCRGVHERFIASEGIDNVWFDTVDEIVPFHVAGRGKVRALGQNEKRKGQESTSPAPSNLYLTCQQTRRSNRKDRLTAKADVRTFYKPALF